MNRLKSLYVKDFRSIDGEVHVSLDAPIVLIHGPNGAGKTSLLSAIELALTGAVPSLSRAEPDYIAYLPHKGRSFGEVHLNVDCEGGVARSADIRVTNNSVAGKPILSGRDASFFSERSYLAQSTLGRLLEIYQHSDRKTDSPLTRFVKELLGLDRMDALIDGLYTAGNIARLKGPVPAYGQVRENISAKERDILKLTQQERDATLQIGELEKRLRDLLGSVDPPLVDVAEDLTELALRLTDDPEESELTELIRSKREVEVSQKSLTSSESAPAAIQRARIETDNQSARAALEAWTDQHGDQIQGMMSRAAALFADFSISSEVTGAAQATLLNGRIESALGRIDRSIAQHEAAVARRDSLVQQLSEARTRLTRIDDQVAATASANESVVKALSDLTTHIHDNVCPVCDRNFSEVSSTPLSAHVATKVAAVVEQAGRLEALIQSRNHNSSEVARIDREQEAVAGATLSESEVTSLKMRAADLRELARELGETLLLMKEGDRLRADATRAAQALLSLRNADQSATVLRSWFDELARRVQIATRPDVPTAELLQEIWSALAHREAALVKRQKARRSARDAVDHLVTARRNRASLEGDLVNHKAELEDLQRKKSEADDIINVARRLTRLTQEARARVVRRVFNDELNAVWRDLFVRLAPEEPFIPAFAIPDAGDAAIEAVLETHHRRGGKGGNPRAMLSAGNLNTAALTLFLALNLSVDAKFPWLVIDDPVQSMDEVHIAQFAALLRTLSKQMGRQVIVAVHERPLFDYLALELSPAFDGDRLNVVELGRNAMGQTASRWDARLYVADRAIAA